MGSYTRETHERIRALIREEVTTQLKEVRGEIESLKELLSELESKLSKRINHVAESNATTNNKQLVAIKSETQMQIHRYAMEQIAPKITALATYIDQKIVDEDVVTEWRHRVHAESTGGKSHRKITNGGAAPSSEITYAFTDDN